ncbi:hypothetical protein [Nocardioides pacificus]
MATLGQAFPRPVLILVALVALVHVGLALQLASSVGAPHHVSLVIAAPPIVAQSLAERAEALPGEPFQAAALADAAEARTRVQEGDVTAAVLVDLVADRDRLLVSTADDPALREAIEVRVAAVGASYGRELEVRVLETAQNPGAERTWAHLLSGAWVVVGFLLAAALTMVRGPVARTGTHAALRLVGLTAVCSILGLVAAVATRSLYAVDLWQLWAIAGAAMLVAAWVMLAFESLFGLAGIGAASAGFLLLAMPLATLRDPSLLPLPWPLLTQLTPHGATIEAVNGLVFFDDVPARPVLVLLVWALVPLLTLALARHERRVTAAA